MTACSRPKCQRGAASGKSICRRHYDGDLNDRVARGEFTRGLVDAAEVVRHVLALKSAGMPYRQMSQLSGVTEHTIFNLRNGKFSTVHANTAERLLGIGVPSSVGTDNPTGRTASLGSTRRLRALYAWGYPQVFLANELGIDRSSVENIIAGRRKLVQVRVARDVCDLFERLQMVEPEDSTAVRFSRSHARRAGYVDLPFSWDDESIDDPDAEPFLPDAKVNWLDRYEELVDMGFTDIQIANRMGIKQCSLVDHLKRLRAAA